MKTSNKILLGTFLTIALIFTSIHVALYAKYKSGAMDDMKVIRNDRFEKHQFKNLRYINLKGLQNVNIIPSDSLRLENEKENANSVKFEIIGDSLVISGSAADEPADNHAKKIRTYQELNLFLPEVDKITVNDCQLHLNGAGDSTKARSYNFDLINEASLELNGNDRPDATSYFKNLTIASAQSSSVNLAEFTVIKQLDLKSAASEFDDKNAVVEKISVDADAKSTITLHGANLKKLSAAK